MNNKNESEIKTITPSENNIDGEVVDTQTKQRVFNKILNSIGDTVLGCKGSSYGGTLKNSQVNIYVDETANTLNCVVKYSDGTVKTGTLANLI